MSDTVKRGVLLVIYGKYYGALDLHKHDSIYKNVHAVDIVIIFMSPAIISFHDYCTAAFKAADALFSLIKHNSLMVPSDQKYIFLNYFYVFFFSPPIKNLNIHLPLIHHVTVLV